SAIRSSEWRTHKKSLTSSQITLKGHKQPPDLRRYPCCVEDQKPRGAAQELKSHDVGLSFLRTEIQTGLSFANLARTAGSDVDKRERNRALALMAVSTVERFLSKVIDVTQDDVAEITANLEQLRQAIAAIPG